MTAQKPRTTPSLLAALADRYGVARSYQASGGRTVSVSDETLEAVLTSLGALTEDGVSTPERSTSPLPAVLVVRSGEKPRLPESIYAAGLSPTGRLTMEDGTELDVRLDQLPSTLPLGWHTLTVPTTHPVPESSDEQAAQPTRHAAEATCLIVIAPSVISAAKDDFSEQRWVLSVQLYSVRSAGSWGIGDLADLRELAALAARHGAAGVAINPLHAHAPRLPVEDSPYLPVTRRFVDHLYLRPDEVDGVEFFTKDDAARCHQARQESQHLGEQENIPRTELYPLRMSILDLAFRRWSQHSDGASREAFAEFRQREGKELASFARWMAHAERAPQGDLPDAPSYDGPASVEERAEFYVWLQWQLDRHLAWAQEAAVSAGCSIGIIHDLAVGVATHSADVATLGDALATGVTVGAPPDPYNQHGQDWSQPPWNPAGLAARAFIPFRDMVRSLLRHAGGVRIDHVLGLFRLWWIPKGHPPTDGTYVASDYASLLGILAVEAERAGAVVIGEDMGTFDEWMREELASRGVLGTSVLWYEYDDGEPATIRDPAEVRRAALTSVSTHDMPPMASYLSGDHVAERARLGLLTTSPEEEARRSAEEKANLLSHAVRRGFLSDDATLEDEIVALYRLLALTPSAVRSVALTDAVAERRSQNHPGTTHTQYPNWCQPLRDGEGRTVMLEDIENHSLFHRVIAAITDGAAASDSRG